MVPMNDANPHRGINRPTGEMIESNGAADRTVMAEQSARAAGEHMWATFEAEALPHADRLFRLAMWFEGNRAEAEDLMQETMLQALQSFHRFQAGTNCRAWLATILQHVRSNRRRARGRSPLVDDPDDRLAQTIPFEAPIPQQLSDEDILSALGRIPAQCQEVIVLCDVEELTYKEIAEALAIPIGTVMSRLHRGRAFLRSELGASAGAGGRRRVVT
jgi:RNA polymerase sigma-70 factor (ECF subfamily)